MKNQEWTPPEVVWLNTENLRLLSHDHDEECRTGGVCDVEVCMPECAEQRLETSYTLTTTAEAHIRATVRVMLDEVHHYINGLPFSAKSLHWAQRYIKELISHYQDPQETSND